MESISANSVLQSGVDLLRRHMLLAGALFSVVFVTLIAFIQALPNVYISTTSIVVEGQRISTNLVPSPMTMGTEGRLQVLSQRIFSRQRLGQIAEQFGLYSELRRERQSGQMIAKAVRGDIGLQVRSSGTSSEDTRVTFDISYRGTDPEKVRQVADALAFFYVEENKKDRQEQVAGTADFLRSQLKGTKEKLEAQERQVAEYKQRHVQELPEHLAANLATLSQLRAQVDALSSSIDVTRERRELLGRRLALISSKPIEGPTLATVGVAPAGSNNIGGQDLPDSGPGVTLVGELEATKARLAQLLVRFSDKHPDVLQVRKEITTLEQKIAVQGTSNQSQVPTSTPSTVSLPANISPAQMVSVAAESARRTTELTNLQTEYAALELEIQRRDTELARFRKEIAQYQAHVENAPKRDQELQRLSRDYASTNELYLSLLKRLDSAMLAGNLDQSQQGERFAVIEPALYPLEPAGPRRRVLSLGAFVLSLGVSLMIILLREVVNPVFHRIEDLRAFTTVEILGSVPQIATDTEWARQRRQRFVRGIAFLTIVCGLGVLSHSFGKDRAQVAKALSQSNGGIQLQ